MSHRPRPQRPKDRRIVFGAHCFWWDSIDQCGRTGTSGLPCCPHCGSILFETPDIAKWWRGNQNAIDEGRAAPDFLALLRWSRGKCYRTQADARAAWVAAGSPT